MPPLTASILRAMRRWWRKPRRTSCRQPQVVRPCPSPAGYGRSDCRHDSMKGRRPVAHRRDGRAHRDMPIRDRRCVDLRSAACKEVERV